MTRKILRGAKLKTQKNSSFSSQSQARRWGRTFRIFVNFFKILFEVSLIIFFQIGSKEQRIVQDQIFECLHQLFWSIFNRTYSETSSLIKLSSILFCRGRTLFYVFWIKYRCRSSPQKQFRRKNSSEKLPEHVNHYTTLRQFRQNLGQNELIQD